MIKTSIPKEEKDTLASSKFPRDKDAAQVKLGDKIRTLAEIDAVENKGVNADGSLKSIAFLFHCTQTPNLNVASELSTGLDSKSRFKLDPILASMGLKYVVDEDGDVAFDDEKCLGQKVMVVWECTLGNQNPPRNYWKPVDFEPAPKGK
jgi:hypothetical protein